MVVLVWFVCENAPVCNPRMGIMNNQSMILYIKCNFWLDLYGTIPDKQLAYLLQMITGNLPPEFACIALLNI